MSITKKAMIVKLHVSAWKGHAKDLNVTSKAQSSFGAEKGSGIYNKYLVPKKSLAEVQAAESKARSFHQKMTLPWNDGGDRLLPSKNFLKYNQGMRQNKQHFETAVSKFCAQYPLLITDAQKVLGQMYSKYEYPDPNFLKEKFAFFTDYTPVPDSGDFRVDMEKIDQDRIKRELDEKNTRSHKEAMKDLWDRLYNVVETMANGLSNGRVYDAYVKNIEELTEILPDLNIADDQALNDMAKEVRDSLTAHTPGQLRKDKKLKDDTVTEANAIMNKMSGVMGHAIK